MAYIGNQTTTSFTSLDKQTITGDGGTAYTLSHAVANAQEIEVFVNNVRQEPGVAYTVSGTALTMTGNVASTDDFYVVFQAKAIQSAVHPSDHPLTASQVDADDIRIGGSQKNDALLTIRDSGTANPMARITFDSGDSDVTNGVNIGYTAATYAPDFEISNRDSGIIRFKTNDSERVRITSGGNVGIGTNSPDQTLHVHKGSAGSVSSASSSVITVENNADAYIQFLTPNTASQQIRFGDPQDNGIGILSYHHTDNSMRFATNGPEKMRLSTNGYLQVGQNTSNNPGQGNSVYGLSLRGDGRVFASASGTYSLGLNRSDNGELTNFSRAGSFKGSINISTSAVSYNTTSDHRLKQNVVDMTGAITRLKTLNPKRFDFIADAGNTVDGFLAHEAQTVVPEAVTGTHNQVQTWTQQEIDDGDAPDGTSAGDNKLDGDGNTIPVYQGIDQAKLVPLLVGALQEAITKIETLETDVTALTARVTALENA